MERAVERQRRPARLNAKPMAQAVAWLSEFRAFWDGNFEQLDDLLEEMKQAERTDNE